MNLIVSSGFALEAIPAQMSGNSTVFFCFSWSRKAACARSNPAKSRIGGTFVAMLAAVALTSCGGGATGSASSAIVGQSSPQGSPQSSPTSSGPSSPPVLTGVFPSGTMVGQPEAVIVVAGMNFTSASQVLVDGTVANSSFINASEIGVSLPNIFGVAANHAIQVSNSAGGSNVLTYSVYAQQEGPFQFAGQPSLSTCQNLTGEGTLADVNGDGLSDLITFSPANGSDPAQLTICFGQKDGTFAQPVPAGFALTKGTPTQILTGDFNRDGSIDLLFIYPGSPGSYLVLLNNGSGQFAAGGSGALPGSGFGRGAVGDFNGDGKLDFVIDTGDTLPQPLARLLGNGDGTFGSPTLLGSNAPEKAAAVIAVDLNGDGITDLVYADYLPFSNPPDSLQMHTLLFHSDGSSTDTLTTGVPVLAWSFAVADFNHDGVPDLFVVDATTGYGQVLAGKGDGTFSPLGNPVFASDGFLVTPPFVTGDFDNDGNLDIATRLTLVGPDVILFLWGDGQGNFTGQIIASDQSFFLTTGDVNGDGIPDILEGAGFGYPGIILGRHDRNFPSAKLLLNAPQGILSSGNVFNDGSHDILVSGSGDCTTASGTPGAVYHVLPNGVPAQEGTAPACNSVLVDLDGDGIADLVGVNQNTILIWKGDGNGNFQGPVTEIPTSVSQYIQELVFRDMDGDGYKDIVVAGSILYGKGGLQFDPVPLPPVPYLDPRFLVGDFDGDGLPDILIPGGIFFGEGARAFTPAFSPAPECWSTGYIAYPAVADLNQDGKDDIVCGGSGAGAVDIYAGVGRSGFLYDGELVVPGGVVQSVSIGDFNGDGRPDLAIGMGGPDDVVIFTNIGNGGYEISSYVVGVNPIDSIVGDFNNDGIQDLAFLNYGYDYKAPAVEVLLHK
jgi:FG-GAP-like repeat